MRRSPSRHTLSVLKAFLDDSNKWLYGYDLMQELGVASGTLYPILMRLHERGVLEARWQDSPVSGRPRRRMYRLSPDRREWAESAVSLAADLPADGTDSTPQSTAEPGWSTT